MRKIIRLTFLLLVAGLTACNFGPRPGPVQPTFPIPNQTMTALFATMPPTIAVTRVPGEATLTLPVLVTATPIPTDDQGSNPPQDQGGKPTATMPRVVTATLTPTPPGGSPATATLRPSLTPTRTATIATPDLSRRMVTSVTAGFLSTKPVIDGDWNDLPQKEYPAEIVVYGESAWKGRSDLAASLRIGWDKTNLYLGVKVRDDVYVQNASGENLFKGDSLEILLDTNVAADFYTTTVSPDDFQLGISPGRPDVKGVKEAYLWLPSAIAGKRSQVVIASRRSDADGITRYEVAIPWSIFEVTPKAGAHYGFVLSVSDNDDPTQNVQQIMVSNDKDRSLFDPSTWGDLTLGN